MGARAELAEAMLRIRALESAKTEQSAQFRIATPNPELPLDMPRNSAFMGLPRQI